MQVTSEKFGLHAGNVKFNTQNEDWISIGPRIIISFLWMQATSEKLGLHAGNVKFNTQNEDWISIGLRIIIYFLWRCGPTRAMATSVLRFLDHTQRCTTVGRTPLDE